MESKVAINRRIKGLKGALGWTLAVSALAYVVVAAGVGAIVR